MASDLITDIVDQQAIDQVNRLKKALDEALTSFNSLAGKNINLGGNVNGNAQQYLNEIAKLQQQILSLTEQIGVAQTRNANTMGSGFKAVNDQYKQLRDTARELAVSQGRGSEAFKQAAKEAALAHGEIRKINSEVRSVSDNAYLFSGGLKNAWGYIRQIAYIMPGIGIAGIFNLAFEAIAQAAQQLDLFKKSEEDLIPLTERLIENYKSWNDTIEWHNSRIDNETKLLVANAKLRKEGIQEIADIEKNANVERMKQLDIELDNYNQQLVTLDRLINFKKVNSSSVSQSFEELNKAYNDTEEKRNEILAKGINLRTQMEVNEVNTKIELQKKAEDELKKHSKERARLTEEIDKLMAEDRYKLMDELNAKLLKLEDKYHEEIAKMRKAKYGDEALAERSYLKEREDIISSYVDKQKELMQRLWQNGKKIAEEAVKEGFTDPFGLTVAVRSGDNRANTLRGGSWEERDTSKREKKSLNDKIKELQEITQQVGNLFSAINDAITNGVNKRFNHEISLIDAREQAELDSLSRMSLGDKERYEKKKKIELEAEARRKKLEHDRIADLRRAAIFQKGIDIAQIIANVALQVTKKGITTPQAIAALLEGTALIAKVVATPIPQYAKGTDNHIGGAAIVGEEGTELGILPSGKKFLTKNKPTLMNLPAKTKIIPHDQLVQSIYHNALIRMSEMGGVSSTDGMQEALIASVMDLKGEMHEMKNAILEKDMTVKLYGDVSKYAHLQRQLR